ncbi:MAG: VWA domain-containing protein, partial [Pirellulales bacterium]
MAGLLVSATLCSPARAAAAEATAPETRLDTYVSPDGTGYFALRLVPNVDLADAPLAAKAGRQVVILFDTSASQAGAVRSKALAALSALVSGLAQNDRVALVAVDLAATPLTQGLVAPDSAELKQALAALHGRAPLGATDMPVALQAAAGMFDDKSAAPKVAIYIGDGVSAAHMLVLDEYRQLVDELVSRQVAVSSYALGVQVDGQLLASLANLTGGMLAIDSDSIDPKQAAAYLASAVRGTVAWPQEVAWPSEFSNVYPKQLPPLRSDRDTIVVGQGTLQGEQKVTATVAVGGKSMPLQWTVSTGESNADFGFLVSLVEASTADDGLRLATVGTPGLKEVRRLLDQATETLAKLGSQAIATGNLGTAERLADEALRRDPNDPTALAVKKQLAKMQSGQPSDARAQKLEVKKFQSEQAAPPQADAAVSVPAPSDAEPEAATPAPAYDPINDGQGRFLENIEQQRRLITAQVKAEVENELRAARSRMGTDPASVEQTLKVTLERVLRVPE